MNPCSYCGGIENLVEVKNEEGEHFWLCFDGISCTRRRMAADGVKLLPHPKNPKAFRVLKGGKT